MNRLLITGGQGFIGRYLAAHWLTSRPDVSVLCVGRSPPDGQNFTHRVTLGNTTLRAPLPPAIARALGAARYRYCSVDLADRASVTRLLTQFRPEAIVHLAGALRDEPSDRLLVNNVGSALNLLEAIAGARLEPRKIVLASSAAVYGHPLSLPLREHDSPKPLDAYAASKLAAEQLSEALALQYSLPLTIARIFNPIGPGADERHFGAALCSQIAAIRGGMRAPELALGALGTTRDFIDVRDVVAGLTLLVERGVAGECYNLGTGVERAIESVFRRALELAGLSSSVRLERMASRAPGVFRHVADPTKIEGLGFRARVSLDESLCEMLDYYAALLAQASRSARDATPARVEFAVQVTTRRAYSVLVEPGIFEQLGARLSEQFPCATIALISDEKVHELHGHRLLADLERRGLRFVQVLVPRGELAKSQRVADSVIGQLYRAGFDRRGVVVNLGGGAICDLGGYVASTYLRGVQYVNAPTTLLAQHDAAIGGKVGVNAPWAKNFVGAFHQPAAVYCDPRLLASLDAAAIAAGVAEAIKVAVCGEPELFTLLEREAPRIRCGREPGLLGEVVRRAAAKKIELLAADPLEVDLRRVLNLGHSFGHALENELGYERLSHGEAVAFGLAVATRIATQRGACPSADAERILHLLDAYGLPPPVPRATLEACSRRLAAIRLARAQRLLFVLPTSVSTVQIVDELLDEEFANAIDALARHPVLGVRVLGPPE